MSGPSLSSSRMAFECVLCGEQRTFSTRTLLAKHYLRKHRHRQVADALARVQSVTESKVKDEHKAREDDEGQDDFVDVEREEGTPSPCRSEPPISPNPDPRESSEIPSVTHSPAHVAVEGVQTKTRPKCPTCGKSFASVGNLNKHRVSHSQTKPWRCEDCSQTFNQRRDFVSHVMQKHSGERPHKCHICGKGFVYKFYLQEHLDYHTGERRFQCPECGKKFQSSSALIKHSHRHGTARAFACKRCPKSFTVSGDLKAHVRFVHDRAARDVIVPVFAAAAGVGAASVPPNYVPIRENVKAEDEADAVVDGVPLYQKPKPVLRMVASEALIFPSAFPPSTAAPVSDAELKELESQRQIEEWMISQGVSIALEPSSSSSSTHQLLHHDLGSQQQHVESTSSLAILSGRGTPWARDLAQCSSGYPISPP